MLQSSGHHQMAIRTFSLNIGNLLSKLKFVRDNLPLQLVCVPSYTQATSSLHLPFRYQSWVSGLNESHISEEIQRSGIVVCMWCVVCVCTCVHACACVCTCVTRGINHQTAAVIIGVSLSEPHTSESNGAIFIYYYYYYGISVVRIPYVCLGCNLTQPHAAYGL